MAMDKAERMSPDDPNVFCSVWTWNGSLWECIFTAAGGRAKSAAKKIQRREHAAGRQCLQGKNETNLIGERLTAEEYYAVELSR